MVGFFRILIFILVTAFCVYFALSNQDAVTMDWSPLHEPYTVPAFVMGLGGLGVGFLIGAFLGWLNLIPKRIENYRLKKQVGKLEKELKAFIPDEEDTEDGIVSADEQTQTKEAIPVYD